MTQKRYGLPTLIAVVSLLCIQPAAVFGESGRRSLQGLKGIYVLVERLDPDVEKDGLTADMLRRDAVSLLQKAGIPVYEKEVWLQSTGNPHLHINANILRLKETAEYVYAVTLSLRENVYLLRSPVEIWAASTWSKGGVIGITGRIEKIRSSVTREIEAFIDAVKSQYPR